MMLDAQERMVIEARVGNDGPSTLLAYLFWFFLGLLSAHRFYLGRPISAVLQIVSFFVIVGFVWLIVDAFLIPKMVRDKQERIREKLTNQAVQARLTYS